MLKKAMRFIRRNGRIIPIMGKRAQKQAPTKMQKLKNTYNKHKPKTIVEWAVVGGAAGVGISSMSQFKQVKESVKNRNKK